MSIRNDITKFLSIVDKNDVKIIKEEVNNNQVLNEGTNPHKVSLPVQMAMQHYQKESLLKKYFNQVQEGKTAEESARKLKLEQKAKAISKKVLERNNLLEADPLAQQYISQLTALMAQATQPWEKKQLEYRIKAVQDGMIPKNKQVLPPAEWEKSTDPTTIARIIGKDGLSPAYLQNSNMFGRGLDFIGIPGQHPSNPSLKY